MSDRHHRFASVVGVSLALIVLASGVFLRGVNGSSSEAREKITLHASGRGNPWINLRDGHDLPTAYVGAANLEQSLEQNLARPLALASDDFDEDGMPDLVSGYADFSGGIVTIHRGNVDALFPNSPEAQQRKAAGTFTDSPFMPQARVFATPEAPDFLGTGDFDGDGHWDVVAAARGSSALYLLPGDGRGALGQAQRADLPGKVTALVTGEVNRRDGLTDIVVGIAGANRPEALVFESPEGALKGQPEAIGLPAEATELALGQLDDGYPMDLVVAAGSELVIVHGRDRKLSIDEFSRAEAPQASISRFSFPLVITSLAIGDFTGKQQTEVALLLADGGVRLVKSRATASTGPASEKVTDGQNEMLADGSWQQATRLICARVSGLPRNDLVVVDSANHQLHILMAAPASEVDASVALPARRVTVSLDVVGEPVMVLPMRLNVDALSDLVVLKASENALTVALTAQMRTFIVNSTGNQNDCRPDDGDCSILDPVAGACRPGVCTLNSAIQEADYSTGADAIHFNIPGAGVPSISSTLPTVLYPVTIDGTTQSAGRVELSGTYSGGSGLFFLGGGNSVVRGLVINRVRFPSGTSGHGITLRESNGNMIEGNFIGTDVNGTVALGNADGINIHYTSHNNTIGGTTPAARNVISGNIDGVFIGSVAGDGGTGNRVLGNFIGTNVTGTAALGNQNVGVWVHVYAANNTVGGTIAGARNIISGNGRDGLLISGSGGGNLAQGNFIGTDINGISALGNSVSVTEGIGVSIARPSTLGGTSPAARNVISGNFHRGVVGNGLVQGNFIGVAANGAALGNGDHGIEPVSNSTIGGIAIGAANTIAFNNGSGVFVDPLSDGITIQGNSIFSNGGSGVFVNFFNESIAIQRNSIFSNDRLGIDLGGDGVTSNDQEDFDLGANNLQNYPVLTAVSGGASTTIQGTLNSKPNSSFTLEFFSNVACDPSGNGEGERFIGSATVATNSNGNVSFNISFPTPISASQFITATATDSSGNTSEFSRCIREGGVPFCTYSLSPLNQTVSPSGGTGNVSVTAPPICSWTACSQESWITITSGGSSSGNGTISYSVAPNNSLVSRTGVLTIASLAFVVSQAGTSGYFTVVALPNAAAPGAPLTVRWTAPVERSTIDVIGLFRVGDPNTNSLSRQNTQGAAAGSFTINAPAQTGSYEFRYLPGNSSTELARSNVVTVSPGGICEYCFTVSSLLFTASGGPGSVNVRSPSSCPWTAASNVAWITITSGGNGSGNGTVSYAVAANTSASSRTGTLLIAGHTFTVTQDGNAAQFEADVGPRPNGDGRLSVIDWVQCGRFVALYDTPTSASEFQRADCAPRGTKGDGRLSVADWVQCGRYVALLDPMMPAGGPTAPASNALTTTLMRAQAETAASGPRTVRVINTSFQRGQRGAVTIELDAQGNENALSFSLNFDPAQLQFVSAAVGSGATGATLIVNSATGGRLGLVLVMPAGQVIAAGLRPIVNVTFEALSGGGAASTTISFGDQPIPREVSDPAANLLPAEFVSGTVTFPGTGPGLAVTSIFPANPTASSSEQSVTVNGSGFQSGLTVTVTTPNGSQSTLGGAQIQNVTPASFVMRITLNAAGNWSLRVNNPDGRQSGPFNFTVNAPGNPAPTLVSLSPSSATAGGAAFTLTVTGANFASGAVVRWNGSNRLTTFASSTQLTAAIPASDIATAGTASVTVFNPLPGGGASNALIFTITQPLPNPVPTITSLSPNSANAGGAGFTLTVNGRDFVSGSVVRWNGSSRATTFVNSTQLTASTTGADIAMAGTGSVTVFNPAPGGGASSALIFTITQRAAVASVSAASFRGAELASESIVAAFGAGLATATQVARTLPLPTELAGTSVKVRDSTGGERLASLFFVAPSQINYLIPGAAVPGTASVIVTNNGNVVATGAAQIAAVAPGLFSANANGQGVAAAVVFRRRANGSESFEPVVRFDQAQNRFVAVPIDLGLETDQVFLILFGTGIRFRSALSAVTVKVGGADMPAPFADAAPGFVGLDQVNVRLLRSLIGRGEVDVALTVDGKAANTVKVNIR